ncbi:MAG: glycosyltransferase family 4 protein [Peptostreptococcaceae bacterium]|nr:glycosyltransferase family 4 protein [Peptostreptococcaceae bacterium]
MKILYIATSFPKQNKGDTIYTDLAEALKEAGHHITIAVSEQAKNLKKTEFKKERGFNVLRIVTGNYYDVGIFEKGITTLKIPFIMKRGISKYLRDEQFDIVLYEAPPVTNASLVNWVKKKFKCSSYLMLKDIFPQNAVDIGVIKKNSLIYKFFKMKEKQLYSSADTIGCMSEGNRSYILKENPDLEKNKIEIFPNTKRLTSEFYTKEFTMRGKYGIGKSDCVFLFGGNMGKPQYIDLLCEAVFECKDCDNIFFLFVGRGTEKYKLENVIKNNKIQNALVVDNLPRVEYEQILKEIDVGLIILDPKFTIPNYPSRILSYMEYSKPVLAATDMTTDFKELINSSGCGKWVFSGDKKIFIEEIKNMANDSRLKQMGENGRKYIVENLYLDKSVKILEEYFKREKR